MAKEDFEISAQKPASKEPAQAQVAEKKDTSLRVMCSEKSVYPMMDPDRNVRIPKVGDVKIAGPVAEGSWLDCQIKAGLVIIVE